MESIALESMRPYQRKKYEWWNWLEGWGELVVGGVLVGGILLSLGTFCSSLYRVLYVDSGVVDVVGNSVVDGEEEGGMLTDGYIYSLEGETDSDGYPLHLREVAEQRYAECIIEAEVGGNDPNELCDVAAFFEDNATGVGGGGGGVPKSGMRSKINTLLNRMGIPSVLSRYLTTLPNQTLAYLSSLLALFLFVLCHYIAHKIHIMTISNDPMKHFVVVDKTVRTDGTVEAKKGETEAQRKKRERLLQAERYKAQMAQLAYEAKTKAQARLARMEGKEAAKREEEEMEKKVVEEQDETVKTYERQFKMIKAGVPEGAILNSFVPLGIEGEEARGILAELYKIKERRAAEAKKAEEEEARKAEEERKEEERKERVAAERLKQMKSGKVSGGPPSLGLPQATTKTATNSARNGKTSLPPKLPKPIEKKGDDKSPGLKVIQPWASPSKKEKRYAAKNKRWDKVTKSWVDRDLDGGADAVPTSVVLMSDEGEKKVDSTRRPVKKKGVLRSNMLGRIRQKSPPPNPSRSKYSTPRPSPPPNNVKIVEQRYDAKNFNPVSPPKLNTEKSEETKTTSQASSQSSSIPVLVRVAESATDGTFSPQTFDNPTEWSRRSTAQDIKAMIEAVEAAPDDQAEALFLGPNTLHTPAFENAMRASNSSWDQRPKASDIIAKIRETERQEKEEEKILRRSGNKPFMGKMTRIDEGRNMIRHMRPPDEFDCKIGTSLLRKSRSQGGIHSDDEISEISMVDDLSVTSATFATPKQLKKPLAERAKKFFSISKLDAGQKNNGKSEGKEETEEEKARKKKAEERAKKFEAMNARRRKGKGDDDGTAVSGISRRHRIRRKRSALAAITPEEKERDDWKKGVFASVINVEQEKWKKSIYAHVINAEETRVANIKAQEDLEELNAAAKRRVENQKRLDAKARKFAARAEKFHKLRRDGDDGSAVNSASTRMRRRRTRKLSGAETTPSNSAIPSSETKPVVAAPQSQAETIVKEDAIQNENITCQNSDELKDEVTGSMGAEKAREGGDEASGNSTNVAESDADEVKPPLSAIKKRKNRKRAHRKKKGPS